MVAKAVSGGWRSGLETRLVGYKTFGGGLPPEEGEVFPPPPPSPQPCNGAESNEGRKRQARLKLRAKCVVAHLNP